MAERKRYIAKHDGNQYILDDIDDFDEYVMVACQDNNASDWLHDKIYPLLDKIEDIQHTIGDIRRYEYPSEAAYTEALHRKFDDFVINSTVAQLSDWLRELIELKEEVMY